MTPEHLPTRPVSELDDRQIPDLLAELRTTAATSGTADDAVIPAIAERELFTLSIIHLELPY